MVIVTDKHRPESFSFPHLEEVYFGARSVNKLSQAADRFHSRSAYIVTGRSIAERTPCIEAIKTILGDCVAGIYTRASSHLWRRSSPPER